MVKNTSLRDVNCSPAKDSVAQAEFCVVPVGEKVFIKTAGLEEHGAAKHAGAAVGPEDLFAGLELAAVGLAVASATILSVEPDEVPDFVNDGGVFPDDNLGGGHTDGGVVEGGG